MQSPPSAGWSGARRLLRRLRDLMAAGTAAEERLNQTVRLIASDMVAEVCSVYIMRAGEVLELFATEGLNPDAVHKTRMRVGEGLIGDIAAHARAIAASDAWAHPNFSYRPETGEDLFRSLMGVPIMRGGRVAGVLAVQNKAQRLYTEEELETLETVAMVLAELIASGDLVNPSEAIMADATAIVPRRLDGLRLNAGLAIGTALLHSPRVTIRQMVAENPVEELERLKTAVADMHTQLDTLLTGSDVMASGELQDVMESYRMFAQDRGWLGRIREAINTGLTAEAGVQKVQNDMRARMREVTDPYLRERLLDLEDLTGRLLTHLSGAVLDTSEMPLDAIVFARAMGPAELLDYDRTKLKGLVLEEGSATSHVAIVARALDIPVLGRVSDVLDRVETGDLVVLDSDNGQVFIRPGQDVLDAVRVSMQAQADLKLRYAATRHLPAMTRDGQSVSLLLNAGLLIDLQHLEETGADGIGLYRTEIPFMVRSSYPNVATQTDIYRKVLEATDTRPVTFRTLDIGGDKALPYFDAGEDENPAMGWRAIRIGLDRPIMLRQQLRALIRAATDRELRVMFPMVATVEEYLRARALLDEELTRAEDLKEAMPERVKVGAMLEVPSLMWQMPQLLARVDFLSVGSNDLLQFLFAWDRGSPRLSDRYDTLTPGVLAFFDDLVRKARAASVPITLCGEMAGRPLEAMMLIGLGFRALSMTAASIGPVKMMTRSLDARQLRPLLDQIMHHPVATLRGTLRGYARDRGIVL
ncbi:phosphoenolpyruvate--protein phosphotransferase [Elstera sp.]|uniref:phosphoenolpyruvate--protein phosphotransferase n=1 Tax=Elstera sp. TaxID=1916664 RepID=UPI0037BE7BE6